MKTFINDGNSEYIGLVIMPQFSYVKGQVWRMENKAFELLAGTLNIDKHLCICFDAPHDARDERPQTYQIRVVQSTRQGLPKMCSRLSVWQCPAFARGVLADVPRVKPKYIITME